MLGWFRRRAAFDQMNVDLSSAFARIKEDIEGQKRMLEELHFHHHGFRKTTTLNHQRMADWIAYFDKSIRKLDGDLRLLETGLKNDLQAIKTTSIDLYKEAYEINRKDLEALKAQILQDVEVFVRENTQKEPVINVDNVNNVNNIMPEGSFESLSNPEKWLAGVLFSTEAPLSYSQISERTGKSINTVRVYMNQLKIKGFIEESTLPNGTKIFGLKHKAKVKKLYNL